MGYRTSRVPLGFSDVFPNERIRHIFDMFQYRLKQISCEDAIFLCSELNYYVSRHENPLMSLSDQLPLLQKFLSQTHINHIFQQMPSPQVRNVYRIEPIIFTRYQILYLIYNLVVLDSGSTTRPLQNNRSKKAFLSAALLANDILLENTYGHLESLNSDDIRKAILEPLRQSARLATPASDFLQQFARGATLFLEYMPNELPDFDELFQQHTELTLKEYYGCLFIVAGHYILSRSSQNRVIFKEMYCQDENICRIMTQYMELESHSLSELQQAFINQANSHFSLPLRERPILRLSNGEAIVLDLAFHTDKAGTGALFVMPQEKRGQLLNAFGYAFEGYAQDILHRLYINSNLVPGSLKKNQHLDPSQQLGEIDAAIIAVPFLILFEIKGKWIKDNPSIEPDYEMYLDDLREKYGKGAKQLARAINNLVDNVSQAQIDGLEIKEIRKIFPILITFDSSLVLPGYTQYFEKEFSDEMIRQNIFQRANKMFQYDQWQVGPLAVMTVDALEWLEESGVNFQLSELLEDYANHRNQSPYETEDTSFVEYIKWSRYKDLILPSERMRQKALKLFRETMNSILSDELANQLLKIDEDAEK